jgi:flagellar motor switch/type III secretory pathway protein FliN
MGTMSTNLPMLNHGEGSRIAMELMQRCSSAIGGAVRRGVPFLGRRNVQIIALEPRVCASNELAENMEPPAFVVELAVEPGGTRAALCLDGPTISFLLDGMLGGDGNSLTQLDPMGLSSAQRAFMGRSVDTVVDSISKVLMRELKLGLRRLPDRPTAKTVGGSMVLLPLLPRQTYIDEETEEERIVDLGMIRMAVSTHALSEAARRGPGGHNTFEDDRIRNTLEQTEIELVAELGRMTMSLGALSDLKVGDTLRLNQPVQSLVEVRADQQVLLRGRPTTIGTTIAIRVVEQDNKDSESASNSEDAGEEAIAVADAHQLATE